MTKSFAFLRHRLTRIGIIPALLTASLLAVVIAVLVVQAWTLRNVAESEAHAAQVQLDVDLAVLKQELHRNGTDWQLGDNGRLMLDGKTADGLDKAVEDVGRITHAVATVFAGDTRQATTIIRPDGVRAVGTKLAPGAAREAVIEHGTVYRGTADILGVAHFTVYEPLRDANGRQVGILFVGVPSNTVQAVLNRIIWQTSVAALAVILLVGVSLWLMLRATLRPLQVLAGSVKTISDGHLDVSVPCAERTDQLGEIGRAVALLREKAKQARALETQAAADHQAKARRQTVMDQFTQDFGASVSGVLTGLGSLAETMRGAAAEVAGAAEHIRRDMASTTSEAELSSQNLATVAAAAEQLTASISEISRQVGQAAQAAREAVDEARATDDTVRSLAEAADQIGHVVSLITSIAAQTNLLALNATIEAARAGEAGKGFAVVAGEVKHLASQTAQATQQVGIQVSAIQNAAGKAANAVRGVTGAIGRVSEVATAIAAAVEQQGSATREIAAQVYTVARSTDKATGAMLDVSAAAERSSLTSQSVLVTADQVTQTSNTLRDEVDHFVTAMQVSQQSNDRRSFERVAGGGITVKIHSAAHGVAEVKIINIALSGAALYCDWPCQAGTKIMLGLPGNGPEVSSRVARIDNSIVAVTFRQDPETLGHVGRAIDWIAARADNAQHRVAA